MGILLSSAAGANTLLVPFVGMLSDHTRGPFVCLHLSFARACCFTHGVHDSLQGKRKPYILLSAILACGGLLWLPHATGLPDLLASYLLLGIGNVSSHFFVSRSNLSLMSLSSRCAGANVGLPSYFSLMPDNVPLHQRGMASGSGHP